MVVCRAPARGYSGDEPVLETGLEFTSPHQDTTIEAILRAVREWNPPWLGRDPPRTESCAVTPLPKREVTCDIDPDTLWDDEEHANRTAATRMCARP